MRIAFIHGNEYLISSEEKQIGGNVVYGGPLFGINTNDKDRFIKVRK